SPTLLAILRLPQPPQKARVNRLAGGAQKRVLDLTQPPNAQRSLTEYCHAPTAKACQMDAGSRPRSHWLLVLCRLPLDGSGGGSSRDFTGGVAAGGVRGTRAGGARLGPGPVTEAGGERKG